VALSRAPERGCHGVSDDMTKRGDVSRDPWRVLVGVAQIPETGLHREIDADEAVRKAIADMAELREVISAHAAFDLMPKRDGRVHVSGRLRARIGQTCVVTLDPIENDIDEPIDLIFAPPEQIPEMADLVDEAEDGDEETPDPPEPIVNGFIDIGRLATDVLFLGIDPYPRKPDAVFEQTVEVADPQDHPFAALKALQEKPGKKPQGNNGDN
jgi:Large ribosomal RNA subunit accumulation protein YceD